MAFRRPTMHTFSVFRQDTPRYVGIDRTGEPLYVANLVEVGVVQALTTNEAFDKARKICYAPILEEVGNVQ